MHAHANNPFHSSLDTIFHTTPSPTGHAPMHDSPASDPTATSALDAITNPGALAAITVPMPTLAPHKADARRRLYHRHASEPFSTPAQCWPGTHWHGRVPSNATYHATIVTAPFDAPAKDDHGAVIAGEFVRRVGVSCHDTGKPPRHTTPLLDVFLEAYARDLDGAQDPAVLAAEAAANAPAIASIATPTGHGVAQYQIRDAIDGDTTAGSIRRVRIESIEGVNGLFVLVAGHPSIVNRDGWLCSLTGDDIARLWPNVLKTGAEFTLMPPAVGNGYVPPAITTSRTTQTIATTYAPDPRVVSGTTRRVPVREIAVAIGAFDPATGFYAVTSTTPDAAGKPAWDWNADDIVERWGDVVAPTTATGATRACPAQIKDAIIDALRQHDGRSVIDVCDYVCSAIGTESNAASLSIATIIAWGDDLIDRNEIHSTFADGATRWFIGPQSNEIPMRRAPVANTGAVREITGLGLKEAKDLVESTLPVVVRRYAIPADANTDACILSRPYDADKPVEANYGCTNATVTVTDDTIGATDDVLLAMLDTWTAGRIRQWRDDAARDFAIMYGVTGATFTAAQVISTLVKRANGIDGGRFVR